MALNPIINALTVPSGTEFPGTVQDFLNLLTEYLEILGLEDFDGINIGATTPDPDNRDLPWFRFDDGGAFMGIFTWNGSDWVLYTPRVRVGTTAERDAIPDIYDVDAGGGLQFYNTDDHILYIGTGTGWEPCRPAPADDQVGDSFYFFSSQQSLASTTGATNWTAVSLASYITQANIPAEKIKACIVRVNASLAMPLGGGISYEVIVRAWNNNLASNSASDVLLARAFTQRDDSATGASDTNTGYIPMTGGQTSIYYNVTQTNNPVLQAQVWLAGFIYTP